MSAVSRHSERPVQTITLVLQAFKEQDGFKALNAILISFSHALQVIVVPPRAGKYDPMNTELMQMNMAVMAVKKILSLYAQIVSGKNVTDATQTISMTTREGRERTRPEFFSPPQFIVELRMAVLPTLRKIWESDLLEKAPSELSEKLIEVIKTIATADSEAGALKRSEKPWPIVKPQRKTFKVSNDHLTAVMDHGYGRDLAIEALYRCNNHISYSLEYCKEIEEQNRPRYPVPEGDITPDEPASSRPRVSESTGSATPAEPSEPATRDLLPPIDSGLDSRSDFDLLLQLAASRTADEGSSRSSDIDKLIADASNPPPAKEDAPAKEEASTKQVTIDDLNDVRILRQFQLLISPSFTKPVC